MFHLFLSHLGTSLSQCIDKHIHTSHILGIELALANNLLRHELDCLVHSGLIVSDLGADETDSLFAHTSIHIRDELRDFGDCTNS
jgi:hypothetical protein